MLEWIVKTGRADADKAASLPEKVLTFSPNFHPDTIDLEVAMFLPTASCNKTLIEKLSVTNTWNEKIAAGLFLADYFINFPRTMTLLQRVGIKWICNLPSVSMHDNEFKQYLSDVGMSVDKEAELLAKFKKEGFRILCCVSSARDAVAFQKIDPDAICVMPSISAYIEGFPTIKDRQSNEQSIFAEMRENGWTGRDLTYRDQTESLSEDMPHILRPRAL